MSAADGAKLYEDTKTSALMSAREGFAKLRRNGKLVGHTPDTPGSNGNSNPASKGSSGPTSDGDSGNASPGSV